MNKDNDLINIGNVDDLPFWCEPKEIFAYLDAVSPSAGSKFKCHVCGGSHWGCSTVGATVDGQSKDVVAPVSVPLQLPDGSNLQMKGKDYPNFHYNIVCITCANTVFLNAAMLHSKIKMMKEFKNG